MKFIAQQGSTIISVLILVIGLAFVLSCYNSDKMPDSIRDILPDKTQSQSHDNGYSDDDGYYDDRGDLGATYAVQVVATTSREEAFSYKRALERDGYSVRVEEDPYGRQGLYYKVRIGKFERESRAVAARNRILRRYVKHFNDSFIYRY